MYDPLAGRPPTTEVLHGTGGTRGAIIGGRDVSERKEAVEALRREQASHGHMGLQNHAPRPVETERPQGMKTIPWRIMLAGLPARRPCDRLGALDEMESRGPARSRGARRTS
jgi:hypothetical protein